MNDWDEAKRYGALTREEIEGLIAEVDAALAPETQPEPDVEAK